MSLQFAGTFAVITGSALLCLGQSAQGPERDLLDRNFGTELPRSPIAIPDALIQIFRESGRAAGLELRNCGSATRTAIVTGRTPREALKQIRAIRPDLEVALLENGIFSVRDKDAGQLLDTILSPTDVEFPDNLTAVVNQLLRNSEVVQSADRLQLKEVPARLGFGKIPRDSTRDKVKAPVHLDGVTLRSALNRFALERGNAIWIYDQEGCSAGTFTLRFAVQ